MSKKNKKEEQKEINSEAATQVAEKEVDKKEKSKEEVLNDELQKEKDKFLRLFAEFENYKKRTSKERLELFKTASQDVMIALLPVLDDFERALTHIEEDKEAEELRKGVFLIYQKLLNDSYDNCIQLLDQLRIKGLALEDIISDIYPLVSKTELPSKTKSYLIKHLAIIESNISKGTDDKLQQLSLVGSFVL